MAFYSVNGGLTVRNTNLYQYHKGRQTIVAYILLRPKLKRNISVISPKCEEGFYDSRIYLNLISYAIFFIIITI